MAQLTSTRETYGRTLLALGRENPDIVVLDADLSKSTMTHLFAREFPRRFFNCGVAEQNMIGIAAGLAASGKTAFASTFAVFATARCFDQLRVCVAQPRLDVKVVATHGGITVGEDGGSHQSVEDLAIIRVLPNMVVLVPADGPETRAMVRWAAAYQGPVYIRTGRLPFPVIFEDTHRFELGRGHVLREGEDVTLAGLGLMVHHCLKAADLLAAQGISARVLSDLGQLDTEEGRIVIGAAVLDDVIGLIILSVVSGLAAGGALTALGIGKVAGLAIGFLVAAILVGSVAAPLIVKAAGRMRVDGALGSLALAFALAYWLRFYLRVALVPEVVPSLGYYARLMAMLIPVWLGLFALFRLYDFQILLGALTVAHVAGHLLALGHALADECFEPFRYLLLPRYIRKRARPVLFRPYRIHRLTKSATHIFMPTDLKT